MPLCHPRQFERGTASCRELPGELERIMCWFRDYKVRTILIPISIRLYVDTGLIPYMPDTVPSQSLGLMHALLRATAVSSMN